MKRLLYIMSFTIFAHQYANLQKFDQSIVPTNNTGSLQTVLKQTQPSERWSVALSADGGTLAIGAPNYNDGTGAVEIYIRSGKTWSMQATLSQNVTKSEEGRVVALSDDGNTLAAGALGANQDGSCNMGTTQIYIRSNTIWTHQITLPQENKIVGKSTKQGPHDQSNVLKKLDPRQTKMLSLFKKADTITAKDVEKLFSISARTARALCQQWVESGFLNIVEKAKKTRSYELNLLLKESL